MRVCPDNMPASTKPDLGSLFLAALLAFVAGPCLSAEAAAPRLHKPPPLDDMTRLSPDQARLARRGWEIVTNTAKSLPEFSGNRLSCSNCHLDAGRKPWAAPLWAAWAARSEDDSFVQTVQSCFVTSMGATKAPERDSEPMAAIEAYSRFLATGLPEGVSPPGRRLKMVGGIVPGTRKSHRADAARGEIVWRRDCQACHGADGSGKGSAGSAPPTWGAGSYSEYSAMAMACCSSGFIKTFMPLGKAGLSDQDALDVAAFINSKPRGEAASFMGKLKARVKAFLAPLPPVIWAKETAREAATGVLSLLEEPDGK